MTQEERDLIARFIARVGGAASPSGFSGSVPTVPGALPPIDPEADRFIADQFASHPEARYRITQMAFVQEAALAEAQHRMQAMQAELEQARQQAQARPAQSRGFFSNLFGAGQAPRQAYAPGGGYPPQYAPSPQASYPPGYQQGMFQSGGSGFLGSALTTAAGVAGGVLAADALTSMFSPHGFGGGFGGGGFGGGMGGGWGGGGNEVINETTVNNYGPQDAAPAGDAWSNTPDPSFDQPMDQSFDNSADQGGGWDDNSGGGFDDTTSV